MFLAPSAFCRSGNKDRCVCLELFHFLPGRWDTLRLRITLLLRISRDKGCDGVGSGFQGKAGTKQGRVCDMGKERVAFLRRERHLQKSGEGKGRRERASRWGWNLGVSQAGKGGCRVMQGF